MSESQRYSSLSSLRRLQNEEDLYESLEETNYQALVTSAEHKCDVDTESNILEQDQYYEEVGKSLESYEWYFQDVSREKAEFLLRLPDNPKGTFLVRPSRFHNCHALSIRNVGVGTGAVKHYRIEHKNNLWHISGNALNVRLNEGFETIPELIQHCQSSADRLFCRLVKVCPQHAAALDHVEINHTDIQLQTRLGQQGGDFTETWSGLLASQGEVAIKKLLEGQNNWAAVSLLIHEAEVMISLQHHNIIGLFGVCFKPESMHIIMEFMKKGNLRDYIRNDKGRSLKLKHLLGFAVQIADGMTYLESRFWVHRNLQAAHILVGESLKSGLVVKVAGLSLTQQITDIKDGCLKDDGENIQEKMLKWTAPEAAFERKFSIKSDVWSFGVLLYELVTYGREPYVDMDGRATLERVKEGYRLPQPLDLYYPNDVYDIMVMCWEEKYKERPTFEHLLSDLKYWKENI